MAKQEWHSGFKALTIKFMMAMKMKANALAIAISIYVQLERIQCDQKNTVSKETEGAFTQVV